MLAVPSITLGTIASQGTPATAAVLQSIIETQISNAKCSYVAAGMMTKPRFDIYFLDPVLASKTTSKIYVETGSAYTPYDLTISNEDIIKINRSTNNALPLQNLLLSNQAALTAGGTGINISRPRTSAGAGAGAGSMAGGYRRRRGSRASRKSGRKSRKSKCRSSKKRSSRKNRS